VEREPVLETGEKPALTPGQLEPVSRCLRTGHPTICM
jgi:hypothetical protein